jgi:hypothetical protein
LFTLGIFTCSSLDNSKFTSLTQLASSRTDNTMMLGQQGIFGASYCPSPDRPSLPEYSRLFRFSKRGVFKIATFTNYPPADIETIDATDVDNQRHSTSS